MTTPPAVPPWNTRVLENPLVIDLPENLPADLDPLTRTAAAALLAQAEGDRDAPRLVERLGHAGVVAVRTPIGAFEVRELVDGWMLVTSPGDPDPVGLAITAYLRARRLADDRLHPPAQPEGPGLGSGPPAPPDVGDPPLSGPAGPALPGLP